MKETCQTAVQRGQLELARTLVIAFWSRSPLGAVDSSRPGCDRVSHRTNDDTTDEKKYQSAFSIRIAQFAVKVVFLLSAGMRKIEQHVKMQSGPAQVSFDEFRVLFPYNISKVKFCRYDLSHVHTTPSGQPAGLREPRCHGVENKVDRCAAVAAKILIYSPKVETVLQPESRDR